MSQTQIKILDSKLVRELSNPKSKQISKTFLKVAFLLFSFEKKKFKFWNCNFLQMECKRVISRDWKLLTFKFESKIFFFFYFFIFCQIQSFYQTKWIREIIFDSLKCCFKIQMKDKNLQKSHYLASILEIKHWRIDDLSTVA